MPNPIKQKISVLISVLFRLIFIFNLVMIFCLFPIASDKILSEENMAIGIVTIDGSCKDYNVSGFCSRLYKQLEMDGKTELQIFDMNPNYTYCEIGCFVEKAEIYDSKGNLLNLTILHNSGIYLKNPLPESGKNTLESSSRTIPSPLFLIIFIFVIFIMTFISIFLFIKRRTQSKKS